jgi:hypothetical protein
MSPLTARSTIVKVVASILGRIRTVATPITISISDALQARAAATGASLDGTAGSTMRAQMPCRLHRPQLAHAAHPGAT